MSMAGDAIDPSVLNTSTLTISRQKERGILVLMALSSFVLTADYSITGVALPSIGRQFNTPPSILSLVIVADTLAIASLLIVGGRLVDRFGHRLIMQIGLLVYAFGSILAGLAPSISILATARVLQGIATALVSPAAFSLIAAFLPEGRARRNGLGLYGITQGASIIVGLFEGGWVVSRAGWHMAYLMMLPLLAISLYLATTVLPRRPKVAERGSLDIAGAVTVTLAMVAIVSGFMTLGSSGFTTSVIIRFAIAAVLLAALSKIEPRVTTPLVPPALLTRPNFAISCAIMLLLMGTVAGQFVVTQLNLQLLLGFSPASAGVASLPGAAAGILSGQFAPLLMKRMQSRTMIIGAVLCQAGGLAFMAATAGEPYMVSVLPGSVICSLATFVAFVGTVDVATRHLPADEQGVGTGVLFTSYQVGIAAETSLALGLIGQHHNQVVRYGFIEAYAVLSIALFVAAFLAMWINHVRSELVE